MSMNVFAYNYVALAELVTELAGPMKIYGGRQVMMSMQHNFEGPYFKGVPGVPLSSSHQSLTLIHLKIIND